MALLSHGEGSMVETREEDGSITFSGIQFSEMSGQSFPIKGRLIGGPMWIFTFNPSHLAPLTNKHCLEILLIQY